MNRNSIQLMQMGSAAFGVMPAPAKGLIASDFERPGRRRRGDDPSREHVASFVLADPPRPARRRGRAFVAALAAVGVAVAGMLV